jgi:hypothetical protein
MPNAQRYNLSENQSFNRIQCEAGFRRGSSQVQILQEPSFPDGSAVTISIYRKNPSRAKLVSGIESISLDGSVNLNALAIKQMADFNRKLSWILMASRERGRRLLLSLWL